MRGFSPLINILLTCAAAVAVVPVLGMPWFAGAPNSDDGNQGQIELMGEAIGRWFTAAGPTTSGADLLTSLETVLLAVIAGTVILALAMLLPPLRSTVRGLTKMVPVVAPLVVIVAIVVESTPAGVEPRYGAFVALALTVFMASAAQQAGEMREPKAAAKPYEAGAGRAF